MGKMGSGFMVGHTEAIKGIYDLKGFIKDHDSKGNQIKLPMWNPQAYEDDMVPYFTRTFQQGIGDVDQRGGIWTGGQSINDVRSRQFNMADVMAQKGLSGNTEMTDLAYNKAREDAINQAMAMSATRSGRTGLGARDVQNANMDFMQNAAREKASSGLQESLNYLNTGYNMFGDIRGRDLQQMSMNDAMKQFYLGQFMNMQEAGRQARIDREQMNVGTQMGILPYNTRRYNSQPYNGQLHLNAGAQFDEGMSSMFGAMGMGGGMGGGGGGGMMGGMMGGGK